MRAKIEEDYGNNQLIVTELPYGVYTNTICQQLTEAMENAIKETNRRRKIQEEYNESHGITPQTIRKSVRDVIKATIVEDIQSKVGFTEKTRFFKEFSKLYGCTPLEYRKNNQKSE